MMFEKYLMVEVRRDLRHERVLMALQVEGVLKEGAVVTIVSGHRVCYLETVESVELRINRDSGDEEVLYRMPLVDVDVENRGKSIEDSSTIDEHVDAFKALGFFEYGGEL